MRSWQSARQGLVNQNSPVTFPVPGLSEVLTAAQRAARGKRYSVDVAGFMLDAEGCALGLARELAAGTWYPSRPRGFWIHEPKPRLISALPFRDRVVQHLLVAATLPRIDRWSAPQSFACRTGFGTHRCLRTAAELARHHRWVLRLDIAKFFPSIDHAVLLDLLRRFTPEPWWAVTQRIVSAPAHVEPTMFRFPGDDLLTPFERPRGLPIGNLTSQIWANMMLTPVDHLIGSHLGLGTFVRYCDDILVFDDDPGRLRAAWQAIEARCDALRLRLHPSKCRLHQTTESVAFLGFVLRWRGDGVVVKLRSENLQHFRARVRFMQQLYACGAIGPEEVGARIRAWLAHASHGHTRTLCRRALQDLAFSRSPLDDP